MQIACTKKLVEQLGIAPEAENDSCTPLYSWSANIVTVNRRKAVVVVNGSNRFGFVLYGLKAKDWKQCSVLMKEEMRNTLLRYGIHPGLVNRYIPENEEMHLVKLSDKRNIARMNKAVKTMEFFSAKLCADNLAQPLVTHKMNNDLVSGIAKDYEYPYNLLFSDLEKHFGEKVFCCKALDLTVSLDLNKHTAWRRLSVPVDFTFEQLHSAIQIAFGWGNYHLYEFEIPTQLNHVIRLVADDEAFGYAQDDEVLQFAAKTKISDFVDCNEFSYTYDLGDDWQHTVKVNGMIENSDKNHPNCMMGEGEAPPEDVGGIDGYLDFMDAMSNPDHPQHESMKTWAGSQWWYKPFDIDFINHRLKQLIIGGTANTY